MALKDIELKANRKVSLRFRRLEEFYGEAVVIDYGMIVICRKGNACIRVNFSEWQLVEGSVITLFPNDMVVISVKSDDFQVEALKYDASLLREASLQLEQTVYSQLKIDRCRKDTQILTNIITSMFSLLRLYFEQEGCICLDQMVLLQLKAFFLGFYDYLYRNPAEKKEENCSLRTKELFGSFMRKLEGHYRESRDVSYYADLLHISPKYLNIIAQRITGHTVKTIIDQYVVLQIKLSLTTERKSAKEIAWAYHFSDLSFFCRYFKQHTGITPQQFRKK